MGTTTGVIADERTHVGRVIVSGRTPKSWEEDLQLFTGRDVNRCPRCGGLIERRPVAATPTRGPPATRELAA
jgi:hypothetical protein